MIAQDTAQLATLAVTGGAVAFAVAVAAWAFRLTAGARRAQRAWRGRVAKLGDRLARADSLFGAHPGLVLVWSAPPESADAPRWGRPRVLGSPTAFASMLKFVDVARQGAGPDAAGALLDGLADLSARSASGEDTTLRRRIQHLIDDGQPFSITIQGPSGRFIEADGRAAGAQLVVWLTDATIRGIEEAGQIGRLEETRRILSEDPEAFIDMLSRAPFPAWRVSSSGRIEWANAAYLEAVEADSLDAALERQIQLEPGLISHASDALKAGEPRTGVRPAVLGGGRRQLQISHFPVSGGAAGVAVDVTSGETARDDLERIRRAHDETLNHMAEGIAVFDQARQLVFHNTAFTRLFKIEEAALNERPSHGELLDRLREKRMLPEQADFAAFKKGELEYYETPPSSETPDELWSLPDGRTLRVARQRHPMGGLLVIFQDMTDQLSLQARYNTQLKVQRATLDKLHEAVAVFGSDGQLRLRNAAFEQMWGLDPEDLDQASFDAIAERGMDLHPDARSWAELKARVTDPSSEARKPVTGEITRRDGAVITWLTRPLPDGATLIAWDDVTDSRKIETALRERAEALEASERIKTEFVEHVSYQLRTPLTTIGGYADLLAHGFAGDLNDRQKEHIGSIQSASEQLAKLIDDILDIAAIDAGQLELDVDEVDLKTVAREAAELVASRAEHAGVKLTVDADSRLEAVEADARRIKQVVYNLLTNALDHVEEGGRVEIGVEMEEGEARLWVADDGVGIAPEQQARVFDRFEAGQGGGAGLGLALVNDIVRLHGGWVQLESAPGEGARVTCHLPRRAGGDADIPQIPLSGGRTASAH